MNQQQNLPNSTAVLILGITSIVFGCSCGLGLILGAIGLSLAKKDEMLYNQAPHLYSDYGNLKAGKTMSLIGLILGILGLLFWVVYFFLIIAAGNL